MTVRFDLTRDQEVELVSDLALRAGLSDAALGRILRELFDPKPDLGAAARESGQQKKGTGEGSLEGAPLAIDSRSGAAAEPTDCRTSPPRAPSGQRRVVFSHVCPACSHLMSGTKCANCGSALSREGTAAYCFLYVIGGRP